MRIRVAPICLSVILLLFLVPSTFQFSSPPAPDDPSLPLITNMKKEPKPHPPGYVEPENPSTAVVGGSDSIPIELSFEGMEQQVPVGVYLAFLVDNSGSMDDNDPQEKRFRAIIDLANTFSPTRNSLDKIAILLLTGGEAVVYQGWSSWSDTAQTMENLIGGGGSGATPIADGMGKANELLAATNGYFKLAILLSDGVPTPDVSTSFPYAKILGEDPYSPEEGLIHDARMKEILYSTIYLMRNPSQPTALIPEVNSLLNQIAKGTNFVNPTPPSDLARYYFRVDADGIADAYADLFGRVMEYAAPLSVFLRERIDDRLLIDADDEVEFVFDDPRMSEYYNILGFGADLEAQGVDSLDAALEHFRNHGVFQVYMNKLVGKARLRFSVKLNLEAVDPGASSEDRICIPVDKQPGQESYIRYKMPTSGPDGVMRTDPLPQATVCFKKGVSVTKHYEPSVTGNTVKISILNLDLNPAEWVEVAEFPTGFVNHSDIQDDIDFKPFELLVENRITPRLVGLIADWVIANEPGVTQLPSQDWDRARQVVSEGVKAGCRQLVNRNLFDHYLSQFSFREDLPEQFPIPDAWVTPQQRGIYRLVRNMDPMSTKFFTFKIHDAGFLQSDDPACWLLWSIDARPPKPTLEESILTMSWFREAGRDRRPVRANPDYSQLLAYAPKPDLFMGTCFKSSTVLTHHRMFLTQDPAEGLWKSMDCADIEVHWPGSGPVNNRLGLTVKIRNGGRQVADAHVKVRTYIIPFTISALNLDLARRTFSYTAPQVIACLANGQIPNVYPGTSGELTIYYDEYQLVESTPSRPSSGTADLSEIKAAILINVVDITPAEGELLTTNNNAIEIVEVSPTRNPDH